MNIDNSQYFYRTAVFTRANNQVALADVNNPGNVSPLEDWMGVVVSLADGKHTVKELVDYMAQQYESAPDNLEETIHSVVERLGEGGLVLLANGPIELPYYLSTPIELYDIEKAKQDMQKDGCPMNNGPLH